MYTERPLLMQTYVCLLVKSVILWFHAVLCTMSVALTLTEWEGWFWADLSASVLKLYMLTSCIVDENGEDVDRSSIEANDYDDVSNICGMFFLWCWIGIGVTNVIVAFVLMVVRDGDVVVGGDIGCGFYIICRRMTC